MYFQNALDILQKLEKSVSGLPKELVNEAKGLTKLAEELMTRPVGKFKPEDRKKFEAIAGELDDVLNMSDMFGSLFYFEADRYDDGEEDDIIKPTKETEAIWKLVAASSQLLYLASLIVDGILNNPDAFEGGD